MAETERDYGERQAIDDLADAMTSGRFVRMKLLLANLHPAETGHLLESLPPITNNCG